MTITNAERAARAKSTVAVYVAIVGDDYTDPSDAISDLLADLRHRCDELGVDYDALDGRAAVNYGAEAAS